MAWTTPFTAVVGAIAEATNWNTSGRDNLLHLRALLPDPTAASQILRSTSTAAASFANPSGDAVLSPGTVTGNSTASAIGSSGLIPNRLVADSLDATQVAAAFASSSIPLSVLSTAVQNKLNSSGLIFMVRTAAEIPSGWTRETSLNGRFAIGAGVSFGSTFVEATDYGSAWAHLHDLGSHTHAVASFNSSTSSLTTMVNFITPDQKHGAHGDHRHASTGTLSASTSNMSTTAWIPPSRAYVFVRRG